MTVSNVSTWALTGVTATIRSCGTALRAAVQGLALCSVGIALARGIASLGNLVPASAFGMGLLFSLLALGLIKPSWLEPGVPFFARHLGLFFVPILVGAGLAWPLEPRVLCPVFATLALSAVVGFTATGFAYEAACRSELR